jgi:hypothetical protein
MKPSRVPGMTRVYILFFWIAAILITTPYAFPHLPEPLTQVLFWGGALCFVVTVIVLAARCRPLGLG